MILLNLEYLDYPFETKALINKHDNDVNPSADEKDTFPSKQKQRIKIIIGSKDKLIRI